MNNFTSTEVEAFVTPAHPYAVFIPGMATTMGLSYAIHSLCKGDEFIIWDGKGWLLPMAIFFKRECDRNAIAEFLVENEVDHQIIN